MPQKHDMLYWSKYTFEHEPIVYLLNNGGHMGSFSILNPNIQQHLIRLEADPNKAGKSKMMLDCRKTGSCGRTLQIRNDYH